MPWWRLPLLFCALLRLACLALERVCPGVRNLRGLSYVTGRQTCEELRVKSETPPRLSARVFVCLLPRFAVIRCRARTRACVQYYKPLRQLPWLIIPICPACPAVCHTCGITLSSRRGLEHHHVIFHQEDLPRQF